MSFLNREKILIIGNSPNVLDKELGEKIDAFDGLIARCSYFETEGYEKYIGSRCDVLIAGCYRVNGSQSKRDYKLVLWLIECEDELWSFGRLRAVQTHKNVVATPRTEYRKLTRILKLKWYPTTGMRGIYYFLKRGYKVFLHGFGFCAVRKDYTGLPHVADFEGHHEPEKEREYVNKLIKKRKLFLFDEGEGNA